MRQWVSTIAAVGALALSLSAQVPAPQQPAASLQERLQQLVAQWQPTSGAPGVSVGLVMRDGTVYSATAGVADRTTQTPLKVDDLMLAGSTGKTFFAALAVQLIEAKRLGLDDKIATYLGNRPWFTRLPNASVT
jgi:D-alanyl-D-alanine carboxypeptidase